MKVAILLGALLLAGCQTPPVVVKTVTVEVPVPVLQKIPVALTADCPADDLAGTQLVDLLGRLASTEDALKDCRDRLARIRALP